MPETPPPTDRRPRRRAALTTAVACVAVAGGIGAWFLVGSGGDAEGCADLRKDERIQKALGEDHAAVTDCAALGTAIRGATVGSVPGEHSLRQAQAMKDVLVAVGERLDDKGGRLDPDLSVPLAVALADYAADTDKLFGIGDADHVSHALPSEPAWQDADGVHMSVPREQLLRTVRDLSQEPAAYVALRTAATRHAAEGLAAVKPGTTGAQLTVPPARNSRTLGSLDGVRADVLRDLGEKEADRWEDEVLAGLTKNAAEPPSYTKDPVGHLVATWQRTLRAKGADALEDQSADMTATWGTALGLDASVRDGLREDAADSFFNERKATLGELD
ncbi:hypothetical protein [Streptomyces antibioticus]|uniref:hypothetical protein n=1 Tax=Streptomyces antibioticus TaxID=1890 RepID=UPI0033A5C80C